MSATMDAILRDAEPVLARHLGFDPEATGMQSIPILKGKERALLVMDLVDALQHHKPSITDSLLDALTSDNHHETVDALYWIATH